MPISAARKVLYPENWREIATAVKQAAGWRCVECGKQCFDPGDDDAYLGYLEGDGPPGAYVLTVHHRDDDPTNNDPENLQALCSPCHLAADRERHQRHAEVTRRLRRQGRGQTSMEQVW